MFDRFSKMTFPALRASALAVLAIFSLASGLTPALAQDSDNQFAAIAYSTTTHAVGYAYDAATQEDAEAAAMARCAEHADDCEVRNWTRNACSALAITPQGDGGWGAAWGNTYTEATLGAYDTCKEFNDSCQIYAWVCNSMAAPQ